MSAQILPRTIAIDGPAASGKSVLAEKLAEALDYFYLDTGLMYRAVTNQVLKSSVPITDEKAVADLAASLEMSAIPLPDKKLCLLFVNGDDVTAELHRPEVDRSVSAISAYAAVRHVMAEQQRRIAERGSIVMAGRDIGTVVLPNAETKIYLDASVDARARRRMSDRLARGQQVTFEQMRNEIVERDRVDSSRDVSPLRAAEDAVHLDNSDLTIDQTLERALAILNQKAKVTSP